jgi:hypothetical protein
MPGRDDPIFTEGVRISSAAVASPTQDTPEGAPADNQPEKREQRTPRSRTAEQPRTQ